MPQSAKDPQLAVKAYSPFHIFYEGPATVVSAMNEVGPFDILPGHIGFFAILSVGDVVIDTGVDDDLVTFTISNGIMSVRDDTVEIFVNI